MFTKQLNLCAGRTWHLTCVKNTHQTRQLIPAPKASLPKSATRLTTCGCIHAATASDAISPVSSVLATAKELADAGVSAAGLAAFAEKSSRYFGATLTQVFFCLQLPLVHAPQMLSHLSIEAAAVL